ncbi:MAG: glycosyltransferase [Coleofasciculaceae cyanobacterium]
MPPAISVVIPVYNGEKTIHETINSVLKQSFCDWELIVINDGSTDLTQSIVSSIKDSRVKLFNYPNAGLSATRNRGIELATGNYISFLDADDLWSSDKLKSQLEALQLNPQAAVAYSWTDCINELGEFLRRGSYLKANGDVYAQLLLIDFIESGSNPLVSRDSLVKVGGFDESLSAGEDHDMWLRLAKHYHFVCVTEPQIFYRVSHKSMSANIIRQAAGNLQVIEKAFRQSPQSLQRLKQPSLANLYKCLTFRTLSGLPERGRGLLAIRFIWQAIRYDLTLLQTRTIWKVLFKIAVMTLLPSSPAQVVFKKTSKISDTTTLLGYLQLDTALTQENFTNNQLQQNKDVFPSLTPDL